MQLINVVVFVYGGREIVIIVVVVVVLAEIQLVNQMISIVMNYLVTMDQLMDNNSNVHKDVFNVEVVGVAVTVSILKVVVVDVHVVKVEIMVKMLIIQ